jgi:hypothetical protein
MRTTPWHPAGDTPPGSQDINPDLALIAARRRHYYHRLIVVELSLP